MKFVYFDGVGRGEQTRLLCHLGGIPFEDVRITKEQWADEKAKAPGGQLPYLVLDDGSILSQSTAIAFYVAELGGLRPSDPLLRARELEFAGCLVDFEGVLRTTFAIQDAAERIKAREDMLKPDGQLHTKLSVLDCLLRQSTTAYYVTDKPGFVDVQCLCYAAYFWGKLLDGIGPAHLDAFPAMRDRAVKVRDEPSVKQYYADQSEMYSVFKIGA